MKLTSARWPETARLQLMPGVGQTSESEGVSLVATPLLRDALPQFAVELSALLLQDGRVELANQVALLRLVDRCRCGDSFCATIYTAPPPEGAWGPGHESMSVEPADGVLVLDLVHGKISCIEVLYRDDVRDELLARCP
jgi:hypothetical protein